MRARLAGRRAEGSGVHIAAVEVDICPDALNEQNSPAPPDDGTVTDNIDAVDCSVLDRFKGEILL